MAEKFIPIRLTLTTDDRQYKSALSGLDKSFGSLPRSAKHSLDKIDREMVSAARSGTSAFNSAFNSIKNKASSAGSAIGSIFKTALSFTGAGLAVNGLTSILGKVTEIGGAVFDVKEKLDRATISFETLLKSREKAASLINSLKQLRNETAGDLTVLTDGARRLLGVGVPLEKTVQILKGLSVGARAFGLTNEELEGVFTAASQVVGKGRLQAEELEQFSERGFGAARKILAEALGISTEKLIELGEQGRIKGLESIEILAKTLETRFPQAAERASATIGSAIGEITQKTTLAAVDALNPAFDRARDGLVKLNKELTPERLNLGSTTITKGLEGTLNIAESTVKALARGEFDVGGAAKAVFDQVSNAISAGVEKGFEKIKNVGGEAISSLKSGVEAAKEQAISAGQSAASSLISGIKGMLKQNSPSLVMIGIGEQAAQSLGDGLSNGQSQQHLGDAADKITRTLIDRTSEGMKRWAKQIEKDGGEAFLQAVEAMAARLGADPNQLLNVMAFESRLNPKARNPRSSGSGLIQFMRDTAPGLGTTIQDIRAMNALEQLKFVEKYWEQFKGMLKTQEAVYTSVLRGKAINDPDKVLFREGTKSYRDNRELDADKSGTITTREATAKVVAQGFTQPTRVRAGQSLASPTVLPSTLSIKPTTGYLPETGEFVLGESHNLSDIPKEFLVELPKIEKAVNAATNSIVTTATAANRAIASTSTTAIDATDKAAKSVSSTIGKTTETLKTSATDNFNYVIKEAEKAGKRVRTIWDEVADGIEASFADAFSQIFTSPKDAFKSLGTGIGRTITGAIGEQVGRGVRNILFGSQVGGDGGGTLAALGVGQVSRNTPGNGILGGLLNRIGFGGGGSGGGSVVGGGSLNLGGLLGPGGTSGFAGPLGGGQSGGGILGGSGGSGGLLGGLFGGNKGGLLGGLLGKFGIGGAASSSLPAGASFAGLVPLQGSVLGGLGAGGAASSVGAASAGGGGLLSSIGALATNPFTIAAAAAIGGGFLLYKLFSGRDLKKLRSTIRGEYQVDIKSDPLLKQVKEIGQGTFGKSWKDKMVETVRLEPSKNLILNYAEATGQNTAKLTLERRKLDPSDEINQYIRPIAREHGGRVWPGQDFLIGERRAEVVRFDGPGMVYPSVPAYQQQASGGHQFPLGLFQAILTEISALRAQMQPVNGKDFVVAQLREAPEEAAQIVETGQARSGSRYALNTFQVAGF